MKKLLLLLFTIPFLAIGQDKGIQFEHGTTWEKVKAKAKAENKFIFVDAFTTWCGPCKFMSANVFPQEKVGTFFNERFVNLKIQMDETAADSEDVKSWYAEAQRFAKDYSINAYPTFLIFDPSGELVHRIVGGGEADEFIAKANDGLNPETQYVTLLKKFEANPTDVVTAKSFATAATKAYDHKMVSKAVEAIINNSKEEDLMNKETVDLIANAAGNSKSKAFEFIRNHKEIVDEVLGAGKAAQVLSYAIVNSEVIPVTRQTKEDILDKTFAEVGKQYPDVDLNPVLLMYKPNYYMSKQNWPAFKDAVQAYIKADPSKISPSQLNSFAWSIFENCDDPACVEAALSWSKMSIENNEDPSLLDTYANLLHKAGKTKEAIQIQEKAIALAPTQSKEEYQATLEKMKAGKPTWIKGSTE